MSRIDFESAVIERSSRVPIVVDFWASWCGPCRMLGPLLDNLADEAAGRWELVKIDTEAQPELARQWNVMSIPAVKLFHQGRPVGEFVGALPENAVREWLGRHLPDADRERLTELVSRWPAEGPALIPELEAIASRRPELSEAHLRLAQACLADEVDAARAALTHGDAAEHPELHRALSDLIELLDYGASVPERALDSFDAARMALRQHRPHDALEKLVDAAEIDARFANELVRRSAVALLQLLGTEDESVLDQRRRLAMALHS